MTAALPETAHGEHFVVRNPGEIKTILDRLQREKLVVTVEFGDGHAMVSSLLEVRHESPTTATAIVIDIARDAAANRLLFAAPSLAFVGEIDHVPILFETRAPSLLAFFDGPAALVDAPLAVTRLQRREWFRASLPLRPPVRCTVLDSRGHASAAQAIDLSCGGAAVVVDDPAFTGAEPGSDHELILSIPDTGRVELEATLRTVRRSAGAPGTLPAGIRLGFRFDGVSPKVESHIQRYVQRLEVERMRTQRRS